MKTHKVRNSLLLLLTALIWGTAFVAQSVGMDYVGPFTYQLCPVPDRGDNADPLHRLFKQSESESGGKEICRDESKKKAYQKTLLIGGICCGRPSG